MTREKVIEGLEYLITAYAFHGEDDECLGEAVELLKEQEAVSPNIKTNVNGIYYACGNCGEMMFGYKYCPTCGRRVKWDEQ